MTTALPNALVTATPSVVGYPTLTGYTDINGQVTLPLNLVISYSLVFSSGVIGSVPSFTPVAATFTLFALKNIGAKSVTVGGLGLGAGKSIPAYRGSFAIKPQTGATFASWKPANLFANNTARSTTLRMPASKASISFVAGAVHVLRNKGVAPFVVAGVSVVPTGTRSLAAGSYPISAKPATGKTFKSWVPFGLFVNPAVTPTSLRMPNSSKSASFVSIAPVGPIYAVAPVFGGGTGANNAYNPVTNTWAARAPDPHPRSRLGAGVFGSKFYAAGGQLTNRKINEGYDRAANTWSARASIPQGRSLYGAGVLGSKFYAAFGKGSLAALSTNYAYDPSANTWAARAGNTPARAFGGAGVVGTKLFVVDGVSTKLNQAYDASTNTWSNRASDLVARNYLAAAAVGSELYAIGGSAIPGGITSDVTGYNAVANTWATRAGMPLKARFQGAAAYSGAVYAIDGFNLVSVNLDNNLVYDPAANTWSSRLVDLNRRPAPAVVAF